jgi:hypothetical protein
MTAKWRTKCTCMEKRDGRWIDLVSQGISSFERTNYLSFEADLEQD